jgi:hypothetical protein
VFYTQPADVNLSYTTFLQGLASRDRLLQRTELSDLGKTVKELVNQGLMCKVDSSEIVRLLDVLGRVGTFHHVILQSKHGSIDDTQAWSM